MKTIIYLILVSACTGIFYLFYHTVLSKLTFFTLNRWYLLATLTISFVIPGITIPGDSIPQNYRVSTLSFSTVAETYIPQASVTAVAANESFDWFSLLPVLYFSVVGILALYFLITLFLLMKRISTNKPAGTGGIKLMKNDKGHKSGSFFNCIFINDEKLSPEELEQVIAHELVHIEQKHSVDKIIARLAQVILWFNPFAYAYSHAIEANHEYEVDHQVAQNSDKEAYAQLILRLVASGNGPLYHHFSKFPLSKRIALLFTKPSKNMKKLFYLGILPLLLISGVFFAKCSSDQSKISKAERRKISTVLMEAKLGKSPLVLIDGKESKPSVLDEIGKKNIGKTKIIVHEGAIKNDSRKDGIIEISTDNGKIDQINISTYGGDKSPDQKITNIVDGTEGLGKNPLVIINGKEYQSNILYKISSKNIQSSGVFRPGWKIEKYGNRTKDGAVVLTTKNQEIFDMTDIEKENLVKLQSISTGEQFYTRISLKQDDGSIIDRLLIKNPGSGSVSSDIRHGAKAIFVVDGKAYTEEEFLKIDQSKTKFLDEHIFGTGRADFYSIPGVDLSQYEAVFWFKNRPAYSQLGREFILKQESLN